MFFSTLKRPNPKASASTRTCAPVEDRYALAATIHDVEQPLRNRYPLIVTCLTGLGIAGVLLWSACTTETASEVCGDGLDNDGNGLADCADTVCAATTPCQEPLPPESACADGVDNDIDGLTDCDDPDCDPIDPCYVPSNEIDCSDNLDDDQDGLTDCDDDDCLSNAVCAGPTTPCGVYPGSLGFVPSEPDPLATATSWDLRSQSGNFCMNNDGYEEWGGYLRATWIDVFNGLLCQDISWATALIAPTPPSFTCALVGCDGRFFDVRITNRETDCTYDDPAQGFNAPFLRGFMEDVGISAYDGTVATGIPSLPTWEDLLNAGGTLPPNATATHLLWTEDPEQAGFGWAFAMLVFDANNGTSDIVSLLMMRP